MRKRVIKSFAVFIMLCITMIVTGCSADNPNTAENDKLKIVAAVFPPYDFAREISNGLADVSMLLKPGTESHSYEPSPRDIIRIKNCDIFIYTGGESDVWVDQILNSIDNPKMKTIKMMDCVNALEEEVVEGMQTPHGGEEVHGHNHDHEHDENEHDFEYDEHVWTSPRNAIAITEQITAAMTECDPKNQTEYAANSKRYIDALKKLDEDFAKIANNASKRMMIFGDRFPFRYFADEYGIEYRAAFPGCSSEAEPSAKTIAYLIDKVKEENIKCIFYIEFSNQKIAKAIEEETGAKPLLFHSCHNVTADELKNGVSYLELMKNNALNLKEAFELCQ